MLLTMCLVVLNRRWEEVGRGVQSCMRCTGAIQVKSDEQTDATKFGSMRELAGLFGLQERQHDMLFCVRTTVSMLHKDVGSRSFHTVLWWAADRPLLGGAFLRRGSPPNC